MAANDIPQGLAMQLTKRTVLIPIDVQMGFDDPSWGRRNNPTMEDNGRALLAAWRQRGLPVVHVRHDSIQPGSTLAPSHPGNAFRPGFEPLPGEALVTKSVNSAFIGTDLELRLRRMDADTLVLFGITTDMCVSTTTRMASNLGFRTILVGDACACFDLKDPEGRIVSADDIHRAHLTTLNAEFAKVVTTQTVLDALAQPAREPQPA
jgi:nicotinamidase-related amidase